jgi:hypothetical protein
MEFLGELIDTETPKLARVRTHTTQHNKTESQTILGGGDYKDFTVPGSGVWGRIMGEKCAHNIQAR